jgi:hypothetical protein
MRAITSGRSVGVFRVAAAGVAVLTAAAPACTRARLSDSPAAASRADAPALQAPADEAAPKAASRDKGRSGPSSLETMVASRKLIRTAQVALEVSSYEEAANEIARLAESQGGYLADAQAARGARDHRRGTLVVRVPAERFAAAYAALKALGKVETETVSTQDVTKAYADLETRLRVKRDAEGRLREILRTRTARLSDVLEAERELTRLTEEIEQIEGERRYYDQQVALSTISAALHEPEAAIRPGALAPLVEALRNSLHALAASAEALLYVTVVALPWAAALALVWAAARAIRRKASTA